MVAWLAGEEWVLEVFRTTGKIYEATASQLYGVPLDRIKKAILNTPSGSTERPPHLRLDTRAAPLH